MKFFADTAEIADIKDLAETGLLDGVTTNPSLIAKSGRDFIEVTREIGGSAQINALGFCVGGTILTNALAVLAARGENLARPIARLCRPINPSG